MTLGWGVAWLAIIHLHIPLIVYRGKFERVFLMGAPLPKETSITDSTRDLTGTTVGRFAVRARLAKGGGKYRGDFATGGSHPRLDIG